MTFRGMGLPAASFYRRITELSGGSLRGFRRRTVCHKYGQYFSPYGGEVKRIEGLWSVLKRGIIGTHIHVSAKHLLKYLGEFEYRWSLRAVSHLKLDRMLHSFAR